MTREELAQECLRIEEAGGDVLGYIAKNMPSYTPRAAWYNLQRECLKREPHQLTEGKPEEKGGEDMGKMIVMAYAVMDAYDKGENVYEWLEAHGYKNSSSIWYQLKSTAKKQDPALYERMCGMKSKRRPSGSAKVKPGENRATVKKEPETVKFGGKEYEKMDKPSPTCCQPARQDCPIKWDDNEAMTDGPEEISMRKLSIKEVPIKELKLRTLQGEMGTYEKPSPTCCQPAPPSGVTVPDELPEEPPEDTMPKLDEAETRERQVIQRNLKAIREIKENAKAEKELKTTKDAKPIYPIGNEEMVFSVKKMDSKLGTWEYCREKDVYIFQSNWLDDQSLNVLALSIKDWLNLAAEIPKALRMLTEIFER